MKYALIILVALILSLVVAVPALAYDLPTQGSDNATDIILWHGDSANVTLSGFDIETAITDAATSIVNEVSDSLTTVLGFIVSVLVTFGLAILAYWRGDKPLFFLSGIAFMIYGFTYWSTSEVYSIVLVVVGIFLGIRAFTGKGMKA